MRKGGLFVDNKDFEIELQDSQEEIQKSVQLPLNFLQFGEIENDDVKVYIKQDVYKKLEKFASSDTSKELGSIIIGNYSEELGKMHVIISDYIEAKYTDASASTLTFTHDTWDYIHKEHERLYPEKKIIGWQHTHPNYGIFLSNYDMFIQENFFNMPFQVAYVIDPIQNTRGFFQWKNGKIQKLKGYYVYDDIGKPIKIEQMKVKNKETVTTVKSSKVVNGVVTILCIAMIGLSIFAKSLENKYEEQLQTQETIFQEMTNQKATINAQADTIAELQKQLEDEKEDKEEVLFKTYTVSRGDTLLKICESNNIDYYANLNIILSINNIDNPNHIHVGQKILLPIVK